MNDLATLLTAVGGLITAATGGVVAVVTAWRSAARERHQAADAAERQEQRIRELQDQLERLRGGGDQP